MAKYGWYTRTFRRGRLHLQFGANLRNWALPIAFGGAIWEDAEMGEYGVCYSCEYFWGMVLNFLCFSARIDWML